jgi:hypothetical protein
MMFAVCYESSYHTPALNRRGLDMICTIDGCVGTARGRGYCSPHYTQWRRHGDPLHKERLYHKGMPAEERFKAFVQKGSGPKACWEWIGGKISTGYGMFHPTPKQSILAHRYAYEQQRGPIPTGQFCLHHCDNRSCVNPRHLFCGTQQANVDDMINKGRDHKRGMAGAENHRAKITEAIVREIRTSPTTAKVLAKRHGVSVSQINIIRQRRAWKHIE